MKTIRLFVASLAMFATVACGSNTNAGNPDSTAVAPSKALLDSVSYYLGINYGQMLVSYDFGEIDFDVMLEGMKDLIAADRTSEDYLESFKYNPQEMNTTINEYLGIRQAYLAAVRAEESKAFFEKNAKEEGVQVTESGLQYKIVNPGSEVKAGPADTVSVHYKGTLLDGTVFDEVPADQDPISLSLDSVIPAWTEGIQLVGEGGSIVLYVPSELGYGERGAGPIPGGSTLIFEVTVHEVKPKAE